MVEVNEETDEFDFAAYGEAEAGKYLRQRAFFTDLAAIVKRIAEECLERRQIKILSVQARAKEWKRLPGGHLRMIGYS